MNIQEIRQKYPQYNDLSDEQLADGFHSKFYSDISKEDFYKSLGVNPPPSLLTQAKDASIAMGYNMLETVAGVEIGRAHV